MNQIAKLQSALYNLGFYTSKIDGVYGPATQAAEHAYALESFDIGPDEPKDKLVFSGPMSTFGGPDDSGMSATEGLAMVQSYFEFAQMSAYFQRGALFWYGRKLDPNTFYVAWRYPKSLRIWLRTHKVKVRANGKCFEAQTIDWGPAEATGRVVDLSPGLAKALGLQTDQTCEVEVPLP